MGRRDARIGAAYLGVVSLGTLLLGLTGFVPLWLALAVFAIFGVLSLRLWLGPQSAEEQARAHYTALIWIGAFLVVFLALQSIFLGTFVFDPLKAVSIVLLLLVAILALYFWNGEDRLLGSLWRGVKVIAPVLLVALVPILAVFAFNGSDIRLWQGLLAGFVIVLGWVSTFLFQEERLAQDRREQEIDLLLALRAEILNFVWKFNQVDFDQVLDELEACKTDSRKRLPVNFIFGQADPVVYRSVLSNLPLIDDVSLSLAVQFYAHLDDISAVTEDIGGQKFKEIGTRATRIDWLIKYVEMQRLAIRLGLVAVRRIEQVVPDARWQRVRDYDKDGEGDE